MVMAVGKCTSIVASTFYFYCPSFPAHVFTYEYDNEGVEKDNYEEKKGNWE